MGPWGHTQWWEKLEILKPLRVLKATWSIIGRLGKMFARGQSLTFKNLPEIAQFELTCPTPPTSDSMPTCPSTPSLC